MKNKIKKYNKPYIPGEKRSQEYNKKIHQEKTIKNRNLILDELLQEAPDDLKLNKDEKLMARNLINTFNNKFKYLHGNSSEETIILGFIFYLKKVDNSRIKPEDYSICKKYGLNTPVFVNISCKISYYYMVTSPITIRQTTSYNHELLIKNGTR